MSDPDQNAEPPPLEDPDSAEPRLSPLLWAWGLVALAMMGCFSAAKLGAFPVFLGVLLCISVFIAIVARRAPPPHRWACFYASIPMSMLFLWWIDVDTVPVVNYTWGDNWWQWYGIPLLVLLVILNLPLVPRIRSLRTAAGAALLLVWAALLPRIYWGGLKSFTLHCTDLVGEAPEAFPVHMGKYWIQTGAGDERIPVEDYDFSLGPPPELGGWTFLQKASGADVCWVEMEGGVVSSVLVWPDD